MVVEARGNLDVAQKITGRGRGQLQPGQACIGAWRVTTAGYLSSPISQLASRRVFTIQSEYELKHSGRPVADHFGRDGRIHFFRALDLELTELPAHMRKNCLASIRKPH